MKTTFINKARKFKMKFRYDYVISNDFVMKIDLRSLLIMKWIINLIINVNENKEVAILSLNVLNDYLIANFKSNAFKTVFNEIFFEIKMKLNKLLIFFLIIVYFI